MASLDLNNDYKKVQDQIKSTQTYVESKTDYIKLTNSAGDSFEEKKSDVTESLNNFKGQSKNYQKQLKNQFEQLLDINNLTGGQGSNSTRYVKKLLVQAIRNSKPEIIKILQEESIKAIGCDQQQVYIPQVIYIKVSSIDLGSLLKKDPNETIGKVLYEKLPVSIQSIPFSMNRELFQRIESGQPYSIDNGQFYLGASGQPLFDIQYVELDNLGQTGPWFKITLLNRVNGINKVAEFLIDYYKTINVFDFTNVIAQIMESISGAISIQGNIGLVQAEDTSKFMLILQRVLGLCFDSVREINVGGAAKVSELDGIDESFFEFTEIDLRNIDQRITNIKRGVVQFEDCGNVDLPVDSESVLNALNNLNFVSDSDLEKGVDQVTDALINNPEWAGLGLSVNVQASVDLNFIKLLVQGLILALLSPKILLPIMTMIKIIGQNVVDTIKSFQTFIKIFKKFIIDLVSRIGAIFVRELFELIRKDIVNLIQQVVIDLAKEKADKRIIIILKLIQILIVIGQFIRDWRRCKSVVDELLQLLKIATTGIPGASGAANAAGGALGSAAGIPGVGGDIPLPLLFGSQLLDGYSASRAFIGSIEEMQKIGAPTGPLPDGSPNLEVLSKFSLLKAQANEENQNGKVQVAIPPLKVPPIIGGFTGPENAYGKKL